MKITVLVLTVLLALTPLALPQTAAADPGDTNCLYPSVNDRFGVAVAGAVGDYSVEQLSAGAYLDWRANPEAPNPAMMRYLPMIHIWWWGIWPTLTDLATMVRANPGRVWLVGNEPDTIWMDNVTPERYAQYYHDIYQVIKASDPGAQVALGGISTVSTLRLAWLDLVLAAYQNSYGQPMPVDIWNIHPYMVNEMHNEWGNEIPPGIPNAVGFGYGAWTQVNDAGASGGTYHQSRAVGARAYFAFQGDTVTIYLRRGPDAGIAHISIDRDLPGGVVDDPINLYAASPGVTSRTYSNLPVRPGLQVNRHNIRVQVTGNKDARSSNTWVRVDYATAPSTASLPQGRLEDNNPLRARLVPTVDDHDNIPMMEQMIRDFRQWMAARGQRNKPLINTEHGILMTEDLGFTYPRVRTFMLNSFDSFLNLTDPATGYPADGDRLLQEWHWFSLDEGLMDGRRINSNLFDPVTKAILPLGLDFRSYVQPLTQNYVDLDMYALAVTPFWPIFAGDPSLLRIEATLRNRGNTASGPFDVTAQSGNGALLTTWPITSLPKRFDPGYMPTLQHDWLVAMSGPRTVRVVADEAGQVADPCGANNERSIQVAPPSGTDLTLSNLRTDPVNLPPVQPGMTTTMTLQVDLSNLGSAGTAASQVEVTFWNGDPAAGGEQIGAQTLTPGNVTLPVVLTFDWLNRPAGWYQVYARVEPVPEETNLVNNTQHLTVLLPGSITYLPVGQRRARVLDRAGELWLPAPVLPSEQAAGRLPKTGQ